MCSRLPTWSEGNLGRVEVHYASVQDVKWEVWSAFKDCLNYSGAILSSLGEVYVNVCMLTSIIEWIVYIYLLLEAWKSIVILKLAIIYHLYSLGHLE